MQKLILAVVVVLALLVGAAFLCQQNPDDEKRENVMRVTPEPHWSDAWTALVSSAGAGLLLVSTSDDYSWVTSTDYGMALVSTSAVYVYGTSNDFSAPSITTGTSAGMGRGVYLDASCPNGCSEVVIIEVFHVEKKPNTPVPATDGLACGVPPCPPMADGVGDHHVNRWAPPGSQQPPWLPGSTRGRPGAPAAGANYPPKVIDSTYRVVFEACAYCSAKPGDKLYQKYMGCQTFAYDPALNPPWTNPTPSDQPSHEFNLTLEQWSIDHGSF